MEDKSHEEVVAPYGWTKKGTPRKRPLPDWYHRVERDKVKVRRTRYDRKQPIHDVLKYHGIVFAWVRKKYKITNYDIDILLFLYSEHIFTKSKLKELSMIYPFGKRKLDFLMDSGYIHSFPSDNPKDAPLYELTHKAKLLVTGIYKKLNGEEELSPIKTGKVFERKERALATGVYRLNNQIKEKKKRRRYIHTPPVKSNKKGGKKKKPLPAAFRLVD